jgi:predicted phage baseplate assembly protein
LPSDPADPNPPQPAASLLQQDPRGALASIWLESLPPKPDGSGPAYDWGEGIADYWAPRYDLLRSGPEDRHFVVEMEEDGIANIRFGDNELGERPRAGESFRARYRVGNGPSGNVGAGAITLLVHQASNLGSDVLSVSNPLPATGGTLPEPMAEAKLNAPYASRIGTYALQRAIIAGDYAEIAERDPRVQRAAADLVWTGSWTEADVAIDPYVAAEDEASQLTDEVETELDKFRRIGHDLHVKFVERVPIDLGLRVCVSPSYLRGHVKAALLDVFSNRNLQDGSLGYFHPDRLLCEDDLFLSRIVAAAQAVPGVVSVSVTRLQRQFEAPNCEIENGVLPISHFEVAQLDNDPGHPDRGRLEIELKGGR